MLRALSLLFLFLFTSLAYANCDFKTGQYVEELKDPSSIQSIKVNVPKIAKYTKNFIQIFSSKAKNIFLTRTAQNLRMTTIIPHLLQI